MYLLIFSENTFVFFSCIRYANKRIDAVSISNILNHRKIQFCVLPYFKFKLKSTSCISYNYKWTLATNFNYSLAGHIMTSVVNIVKNDDLKFLFLKVQREP